MHPGNCQRADLQLCMHIHSLYQSLKLRLSPGAWRCREQIFSTLHGAIGAFGLQNCWEAKPLLTGKEVNLPCMSMEHV